MGCCVSTDASQVSKSESEGKKRCSKSPPPTHSIQEEEAVKEVLSETPAVPKRRRPAFPEIGRTETPFIKAAPLLTAGLSKPQNGVFSKKPYIGSGNEQVSEELSEICSTVSESVSVSTSVTERKDRENEVLSRSRNRSPARVGNQPFPGECRRDRSSGKSPYRRSDPSPGRVRAGPGTGSGRRKDSNEEIPAKRSRSPMIRADSGTGLVKPSSGRIQTARRAGKSPSRVGTGSRENIRKLEEDADSRDQQWSKDSNELLENPLVSLECFIFL